MFAKRPKRGETDDDLQAFQEEFLKNSASSNSGAGAPSAKVIRVQQQQQHGDSEVSQSSSNLGSAKNSDSKCDVDDIDMEVDQTLLLKEVVESTSVDMSEAFNQTHKLTTKGFPEVSQLPESLLKSTSITGGKDTKKKSLFAQHMEAKKKLKDSQGNQQFKECDLAVGGSKLAQEIHAENVRKLAEMARKEIEIERRDILNSFDPALIDILKNRKHKAVLGTRDTSIDKVLPSTVDAKDKIEKIELPVNPEPGWLHMDKVEHDKLKWMQDIKPEERTKKMSNIAARFDFHGNLIDPTQDIASNKGLHHHGEEPDLAGYTLEELYTLARSLNLSQKILALTTIAEIIQKVKLGMYIHHIKASIMQVLLDADIVPLLRYALDDKSDLVIAAAINAFRSLLVNENDESMLDRCFIAYSGHEVPELSSPAPDDLDDNDKEEEQYLELLKRDVISGVVEMDLLPRLRYILEVCRPQQRVSSDILSILTRISQTSSGFAYKVTQCSRLLDLIMSEFLPFTWSSSVDGDVLLHGRPSVEAVKLIRMICSSGRSMASLLTSKRGIMDRLIRYLSVASIRDLDMTEKAAVELTVECLRTWRVLIMYGCNTDTFYDFYPSLLTRIRSEVNDAVKASLVCLMEATLSAACNSAANVEKKVRFGEPGTYEAVLPTINWSTVAGLIDPLYSIMKGQSFYFIKNFACQHESYKLDVLTATTNFVASYLLHARVQPLSGDWSFHSENMIKELCDSFKSLLVSVSFTKLMSLVRQNSVLLNKHGFLCDESSNRLPSLCSVLKPVQITDEMSGEPNSTIDMSALLYLQSIVRLLHCLVKCNYTMSREMLQLLLRHPEFYTYVKQVANVRVYNSECYFIRYEIETLTSVTQLALLESDFCTQILHKMSLVLVTLCPASLVAVLYDLLNSAVFNQMFYRNILASTECSSLLTSCMSSLPSISVAYISMALPIGRSMTQAKCLRERVVTQIESVTVPHRSGSLLPSDWPFLPIMHLYQQSTLINQPEETTIAPDVEQLVKSCLQFILLLERSQPDILQSVPLHAKIARVMCTFLLDNDMFLSADMNLLLSSLLQSYIQHVDRLDFHKPTPGLNSFTSLYSALLDQFESVSFGDATFAQYVLLPMCQRQAVELRKSVWSDHPAALRSIMVTPQELIFPVEELLFPEETCTSVIVLMARHLFSGTVTLRRNHLLYLVSLHHVNRFMFTRDEKDMDLKRSLLTSASNCTVEPLGFHLTHYRQYNPKEENGIECYISLPEHRLHSLQNR